MASANPVELMRETSQNATELESSTNTWMKYSKLMMFTAKLPRIPAVWNIRYTCGSAVCHGNNKFYLDIMLIKD
jgi:hypothetical protein